MTNERNTPAVEVGLSQDRSLQISNRLATTARKLRLATSSRSALFKVVGLRPRLADRIFAGLVTLAFVLFLIIPNVFSITYFGFIASPQYESETRFTVRSSTPALGKDQLGKATGVPTSKIVQDTQVVMNFIRSEEMTTKLKQTLNLHQLYSSPTIDILSRLRPDAGKERLQKYWLSMTSVGVNASSGIVTVKVRAFSSGGAQSVLKAVVTASEEMVNQMNDRIWKDVIETAKRNMSVSVEKLQAARQRLQEARNLSGVLDVSGSSSALSTLILGVQKEVLDLQQRYNSQRSVVSKSAPQLRVLQREIEAKNQQLEQLKSQIAGHGAVGKSLADVSTDISQLELEQGLAEQHFASSVRTLEQIQFVSKQQLVYLDPFLAPTLPDEPQYPKPLFWIVSVFILSLLGFAICLGGMTTLRNKLS
ncbi:capsule biosynthesis protein [Agrobacterium rosae]